jgi:hypothetical protein
VVGWESYESKEEFSSTLYEADAWVIAIVDFNTMMTSFYMRIDSILREGGIEDFVDYSTPGPATRLIPARETETVIVSVLDLLDASPVDSVLDQLRLYVGPWDRERLELGKIFLLPFRVRDEALPYLINCGAVEIDPSEIKPLLELRIDDLVRFTTDKAWPVCSEP